MSRQRLFVATLNRKDGPTSILFSIDRFLVASTILKFVGIVTGVVVVLKVIRTIHKKRKK